VARSLLHFSDSHGRVPTPGPVEYDIVVCSGDLLPDYYPRKAERERLNLPWALPASPARQEQWLKTQLEKFKTLTRGKPFLFTPGNHDFYDPVPMLCEAGVDAHNLTERVVEIAGIRFYGFPYVPWAGGAFNYELKPPEMQTKIEALIALLNQDAIDVLVAHCPPYKMFDRAKNGLECGNMRMAKLLVEMPEEKLPKAYLCGHVHSDAGDGRFRGMYVSNAATKMRLIPIDE